MQKILSLFLFSILCLLCKGEENIDSVYVVKYREIPCNFIARSKLDPPRIQRRLNKAILLIIAPEDIKKMADDPSVSREKFEKLIGKGCSRIIYILEHNITQYQKFARSRMDRISYDQQKKEILSTFESDLSKENPDWYDFYVIKNGRTENWNQDRQLIIHIRSFSKSYLKYVDALADAEREYQAPRFEINDNILAVRVALRHYQTSAIKLFMAYRHNKK